MFTVIELKYYLVGCMKLPMNVDIYSIAFDFETIWRIVGGATGTRATNIKRPLGGLSNLFIFISDESQIIRSTFISRQANCCIF